MIRFWSLREALRHVYGRGRKEPRKEHHGNVLVEVTSYVLVDLGQDLHDVGSGDRDLDMVIGRALESAVGRGRAVQLLGTRKAVEVALKPPGTFKRSNLSDLGFDDSG